MQQKVADLQTSNDRRQMTQQYETAPSFFNANDRAKQMIQNFTKSYLDHQVSHGSVVKIGINELIRKTET